MYRPHRGAGCLHRGGHVIQRGTLVRRGVGVFPHIHPDPAVHCNDHAGFLVEEHAFGVVVVDAGGLGEGRFQVGQCGPHQGAVIDLAGVHRAGVEGTSLGTVQGAFALGFPAEELAGVGNDAVFVIFRAGTVVEVLRELALIEQGPGFPVRFAGAVPQAALEAACIQDRAAVLRVQDPFPAVLVFLKPALVHGIAGGPVAHPLAAVLVVFKAALIHQAALAVPQGAVAGAYAGHHIPHIHHGAVRCPDVGHARVVGQGHIVKIKGHRGHDLFRLGGFGCHLWGKHGKVQEHRRTQHQDQGQEQLFVDPVPPHTEIILGRLGFEGDQGLDLFGKRRDELGRQDVDVEHPLDPHDQHAEGVGDGRHHTLENTCQQLEQRLTPFRSECVTAAFRSGKCRCGKRCHTGSPAEPPQTCSWRRTSGLPGTVPSPCRRSPGSR